jgi:hypothetical protein
VPVAGPLVVQILIIAAVVALLALILRWTFGRGRDAKAVIWPTDRRSNTPADYGLLAAAATVVSEDEARRVRDILGLAGIKATVAPDAASNRWKVLVFSSELHRARRVAGGSGG